MELLCMNSKKEILKIVHVIILMILITFLILIDFDNILLDEK